MYKSQVQQILRTNSPEQGTNSEGEDDMQILLEKSGGG
jgi:hypothetical protein